VTGNSNNGERRRPFHPFVTRLSPVLVVSGLPPRRYDALRYTFTTPVEYGIKHQ
jgi:hypothetical protein